MATRIVEDGTGLSDANTYTALAYFVNFLDLSNKTCCADDNDKEAQLYNATRYIETVYYGKIIGEPLVSTQALIFPRLLSDGTTLYPDNLQLAVCDLAMKSSANDGVLLADSNQKVTEKKVDVITVKYADYGIDEQQYNTVYNLLEPYLIDSSSSEYYHETAR